MSKQKVVVIGSGIGGLASAIRMSNLGYQCVVYESSSTLGGKVSNLNLNGFRFDTGPSLFTLPDLLDQLFIDSGENPSDYYTYKSLDIITKYFFENGKEFLAYSNVEKLASNFEKVFGEPKNNVLNFLNNTRIMYETTKDIFLFNSIHKIGTFTPKNMLGCLKNLNKLNPFKTMNASNRLNFEKQETIQLFNRYATYNGSDPFLAPSTLNIISHLEHNIGAYYLEGGMYALTQSLIKLAKKKGIQFKTSKRVEKILIDHKKAVGVLASDEKEYADVIISNTDIQNVYNKLIPTISKPKKILNQPKSTSALIFYWGVEGIYNQLDLHNILFSKDYKNEFDCLQKKSISNDPTIYIYISSKISKNDAPNNCENWFVMINVPHDSGQNWMDLRKQARIAILKKIKRQLGIDLNDKIREERYLDPPEIEKNTASIGGSLYGSSSNNLLAAFYRHPNFSRKIKNLYFTGGSVHPGGGIPLCLASAKIIEKLIK